MCIDILEFVIAIFNLNLAFAQLFICSYRIKIRIHIVYIVVQQKIYIVKQIHG